ncbi:MAG: hypothetical protein ACM3PU_11405 [Gemmatimonadota bacterium]
MDRIVKSAAGPATGPLFGERCPLAGSSGRNRATVRVRLGGADIDAVDQCTCGARIVCLCCRLREPAAVQRAAA